MRLFPAFVYYFYRLLCSSWRIQIIEHPAMQELVENNSPLILAHWHGDELAILHLVKRYKLATMTSTSKDGALVDYIIHRFGGATSRGSSTRGGVKALIGLIRLCKSGRITSVAVDGPRGPIYQPKPGILELSKICCASIAPTAVHSSLSYRFEKSWNKAFLPLPFSKVIIYFGEPLPPLNQDEDSKQLSHANRLRDHLFAAQSHLAKLIATD